MAEIIPALNKAILSRMTSGEKRFSRRLEALLEDDYLCWYDIPVGKQRRYPDFILLHPSRGLLFLEVKDWKLETIKHLSKTTVDLQTSDGRKTVAHPLEQARQYTYPVISLLQSDPQLCQLNEQYAGKLAFPYGWGVVFTNISRKQMVKALPEDQREILMPDHLVIYKDEMQENTDAEQFQEQLWGMFNYNFGEKLSLPQIDRVRWHLFPEVRIGDEQTDLFASPVVVEKGSPFKDKNLPDIIKIMDIQQEQLARSLGTGHRVIHGVAGSGKTLILGYRCMQLAQVTTKPILVLCFNVSLAAKLRAYISGKGIEGQVQVYHFHDWCGEQIKTYHADIIESDEPVWERQVKTVIAAVESQQIPRAQYGALLIDEGHDFEEAWLKLVTQMIDPETDSLLLLYDDAQSIYRQRSGLGFSLSSVGVKAVGRTSILKLNYRNTREILDFAYQFAKHYINPESADEDHIPVIEPESVGRSGPIPEVRQFQSFNQEVDFTLRCLKKWHVQGVSWNDMAVLYPQRHQGAVIAKRLKAKDIPCIWMADKKYKINYDPDIDQVPVMAIHSSKGLEFSRVVIIGIGALNDQERFVEDARLLYVGMTRAQEYLMLTTSSMTNKLCQRILDVYEQRI